MGAGDHPIALDEALGLSEGPEHPSPDGEFKEAEDDEDEAEDAEDHDAQEVADEFEERDEGSGEHDERCDVAHPFDSLEECVAEGGLEEDEDDEDDLVGSEAGLSFEDRPEYEVPEEAPCPEGDEEPAESVIDFPDFLFGESGSDLDGVFVVVDGLVGPEFEVSGDGFAAELAAVEGGRDRFSAFGAVDEHFCSSGRSLASCSGFFLLGGLGFCGFTFRGLFGGRFRGGRFRGGRLVGGGF